MRARGRGTGPQRVIALLLFLVVGCNWMGGGGKEKSEAPAPQGAADAAAGFETGWLGHVSRTYPGGLAETTDAAKTALKRLNIDIDPDQPGMFETTLEGESRDGTSLIVIVKEVTRDTTRVAIKVGYLLGDGDKSRRIHSEIENELKARRDEEALRRQRWGSGRTSTTMPSAGTARPPGAP